MSENFPRGYKNNAVKISLQRYYININVRFHNNKTLFHFDKIVYFLGILCRFLRILSISNKIFDIICLFQKKVVTLCENLF